MYAIVTFHTPVYHEGVFRAAVAVEAGTTTNVPDSQDVTEIFIVATPKMWIFMDNIAGMSWTSTVPQGIPVV